MLDNWTRFVLKRRFTVLLIWLIIAILGILSSFGLNSRLTTSLSIPHSPSAKADQILLNKFHQNIEGTFTVIYNFKQGSEAAIKSFESDIARSSKVIPTSAVTQEKALGGNLFVNVGTGLDLRDAAKYTELFRASLISNGLKGALVTGPPAIEHDVTPVLATDLHRGEYIGVLIALALLLLVLGFSWQVLVPILFALGTVSATLGLIYLIAQKFLVVLYVPNIVELIGLGLAIDYSLLIIFRFRREISKTPESSETAIIRTMASAGRTVRISGLTVAIGLATLILVPIPFIRSLGITSILVPLVSLAAVFTLQPVLLSYFSKTYPSQRNYEAPFTQLASFIIRRPRIVAATSLLALGALSLSAFSLHLTPSSLTALPPQLESQRALAMVTSSAGAGVITPHEIVIDLRSDRRASNNEVDLARVNLSRYLLKVPEILVVATGTKSPYLDASGQYLRLFVVGRHSFGAPQSQVLVAQLRALKLHQFGFTASATLYLGGAAAQGVDLLNVLGASFPWILALALVLTLLLLTRAFNSIVLPLKAIILDLISLAVAYGIVVLTFGSGAFSRVLGIYHLTQIEAWACVFLFILLFGVSMDYEIFMISGIKEAKDQGRDNSKAIVEGIAQTGVVVTASAFIFVGAVAGLALSHFAGLQEVGIGLVFGVLIDATIIRGLLLPSVMVLLGNWNWWMPARIAKIMKTTPAPLNEVLG